MQTINIAGAGGIGRAAALIALNGLKREFKVVVGDKSETALKSLRAFCHDHPNLKTYILDTEKDLSDIFSVSDVVLDCLPGALAPAIARLALKHGCHYANLTEYVAETDEIKKMARDAETGFILQTGLAPGYINVLGMKLLNEFRSKYQVDKVEDLQMKVGALTRTAIAPHFYGFTWSPIGVATEYVKDAVVLRDHRVVTVTALSEIQKLMIQGEWYEANYTSGGAADLPEALSDVVRNLDYRTLRYPGHYEWVKNVLETAPVGEDRIQYLQKTMLDSIPMYEDDLVLLYVHVTGYDHNGRLRRLDKTIEVEAMELDGRRLTAIQSTTAGPLIQSALMLLEGKHQGVVLQSMIDPEAFLSGEVVQRVYGQ